MGAPVPASCHRYRRPETPNLSAIPEPRSDSCLARGHEAARDRPEGLRGQEPGQRSEGPAAVADPVLLLVRELGHRAVLALAGTKIGS